MPSLILTKSEERFYIAIGDDACRLIFNTLRIRCKLTLMVILI